MEKWTVQATDQDILQHVGLRIDSRILITDDGEEYEVGNEEYEAGNMVELSDAGYLAEFHAYRVGGESGSVGYDLYVSVRLAEPARTYADVFATEWDACDAE